MVALNLSLQFLPILPLGDPREITKTHEAEFYASGAPASKPAISLQTDKIYLSFEASWLN
ncbi:MAG: hypothetical protein WBA93_04185 [Microcoleaceae cyanobacterium]